VATPGLGQLYSGRPFRAISLYLFAGGIVLVSISAAFILYQPWNIIALLAGILFFWLLSLGDAIRSARRAALDYRLRFYNRWYILSFIGRPDRDSAEPSGTFSSCSMGRRQECHRIDASDGGDWRPPPG